ncbi:MAG: hypothetical protein C4297_01615 [Gemmataceae bacterium]
MNKLALVVTATLWAAHSLTAAPPAKISYNAHIRPILAENCFACHGTDQKARKGKLRLDVPDMVYADRGGYRILVPGKPEESELYLRITAEAHTERMPPPDSGKVLKPEHIALIRRWIEQGAQYEKHWSFLPIHKPPLPQVRNHSWVRNEIDTFVLARLEAEGLTPSAEADRRTLIRRLYLDLTGLPPPLEEVRAFASDPAPDAYDRLVDRLLASSHYGEHMARYWLDAVRYGDTHGLHLDNYREIWPYRDWVVNAFNRNMPYKQFLIEQLAGDLLPNPTREQIIATGYNRCHVSTNEGGVIPEEIYVRNVLDRTETTGTVFLGLTLGCCVCHDHKYEPLTQKDFYQLFAFFNSMDGNEMDGNIKDPPPVIRVPGAEDEKKMQELEHKIADLDRKMKERERSADADFAKWLTEASGHIERFTEVRDGLVARYPLDETAGEAVANVAGERRPAVLNGGPAWKAGHSGHALECDGQRFVDAGQVGDFERHQSFSYGCWVYWNGSPEGMSPLSRMNDVEGFRGYDVYIGGGRVSAHVVHRWSDNALKITSKKPIPAKKWTHLFVTYDGSSKAAGLRLFIDGVLQEVDVEADSLKDTIRTQTGLRIGRRNPGSGFKGMIDDVQIFSRALANHEVEIVAGKNPIGPILATPADKRSPEQAATLRRYYLERIDMPYTTLKNEQDTLRRHLREIESKVPTTMVMKEKPTPKEAFILIRGAYDKKGEKVRRDTPAILPPFPADAPRNRLGLALWLTDPQQPLTARVAVNRFWQQIFGVGLVKTAEDFGVQGEWPSHPELLDWLAAQFVEDHWDVKKLMKRIVTSATYRQVSRVTPALYERDPENRLLARGPRFRLDAEVLRDQALELGGLLVKRLGGPPVKLPQPPGIWEAVAYPTSNTAKFTPDSGEKIYRRSLYAFWKRTAPPPQMTTFDVPSREACRVRRERTNTPLQALVTMNEVQYIEAAKGLARRMLKEGGPSTADRLRYGFEVATCRLPKASELAVLQKVLDDSLTHYAAHKEAAQALLQFGESPRDDAIPPQEWAAWTIVANLLLNLDEVLNKN